MPDDDLRNTGTTALHFRLSAIESLITVKIVEPNEDFTKAMVERVTSAIEAALSERENIGADEGGLAPLSRKISAKGQESGQPVTPRDAYVTLRALKEMGYTIIPPETES